MVPSEISWDMLKIRLWLKGVIVNRLFKDCCCRMRLSIIDAVLDGRVVAVSGRLLSVRLMLVVLFEHHMPMITRYFSELVRRC